MTGALVGSRLMQNHAHSQLSLSVTVAPAFFTIDCVNYVPDGLSVAQTPCIGMRAVVGCDAHYRVFHPGSARCESVAGEWGAWKDSPAYTVSRLMVSIKQVWAYAKFAGLDLGSA